jgi:hypothetical protein
MGNEGHDHGHGPRVSFFKRLFGKKDRPPADEPVAEEVLAEEAVLAEEEVLTEEAVLTEEVPLAEPQPTVESPVLTVDDLAFSAEPEPDPEPEPEPEEQAFLEEPPVAEQPSEEEPPAPPPFTPPEPVAPITIDRMDERTALEALEQALEELGSAHHRPFSRG